MSRKDSQDQKASMSLMFRGTEIFKPLNTGRIDDRVSCVREWVANIFFYTKNGTTIMIDAGYNYERLAEKMSWLEIDPVSIGHILITHQDTDHVGALEEDSELLFKDAAIYLSEIENRYLTGEVRRKVLWGLYKLPRVKAPNQKVLLKDGEIFQIGDIKIETILVPGHTWGHLVYLVDDAYLFTGDTLSMSRKDEIKSAYRSLGKTHGIYDGQMLGTTRIGRFMLKHVWNMTREDALEYQAQAFEPIPVDFSGKLLEVPVGTGVLSMPIWATLPGADITCLDYSEKMMEAARNRAKEAGIKNVKFLQGDVGALPFEDESFDIVVSLNGFHAFPDKEAAYRETFRVLKPGGIFTGCFYVEGSCAKTDKMIRRLYIKAGFFTPPFETVESLRERLGRMYAETRVKNVQAIAVFNCVK